MNITHIFSSQIKSVCGSRARCESRAPGFSGPRPWSLHRRSGYRPTSADRPARLPHIAFNSWGQLVKRDGFGKLVPAGRDEIIPLVEGSVFHERDRFGNYRPTRPDVVATGGFSNYDESIAYFDSPAIEMFLMLIMLICAVSFFVYLAAVQKRWRRVRAEEEGKWFLIIIFGCIALVTFNLTVESHTIESFPEAVRKAAFQVVAIGTTTGYATADFAKWPGFSVAVFELIRITL